MGHRLGVAASALIAHDGRILLVRRSDASSHDPGAWEPPGGKMNVDEPITDALSREVAEETGISIEIGHPVAVWQFVKEPFWVTGITFECQHAGGELALSGEHQDAGWFTLDEAFALPLGGSVREQLEAYRSLRSSAPDGGTFGAGACGRG